MPPAPTPRPFYVNAIADGEAEAVLPERVPARADALLWAAAKAVAGARFPVVTAPPAWSATAESAARVLGVCLPAAAVNFVFPALELPRRPWLARAAGKGDVRFVAESAAPAEFFSAELAPSLRALAAAARPHAVLFQAVLASVWFPAGWPGLLEGLNAAFPGAPDIDLALRFSDDASVRYAQVSSVLNGGRGRLGRVRPDLLSGAAMNLPPCVLRDLGWLRIDPIRGDVAARVPGLRKPAACARCRFDASCPGVRAAYLERHGDAEFVPVA